MKALFFGSVGAVVETSELQREAFNLAFAQHGLDWHWDVQEYRSMLGQSGGKDRIADYAAQTGISIDPKQIHQTKTRLFDDLLKARGVTPRPGVVESLRLSRELGMKTAFGSTTAASTVSALLDAQDGLLAQLFDTATSAEDGFAQKPAPDVYRALCQRFQIAPEQALVVEDNAPGLEAARMSGAHVIAFLGANTQDHSTQTADWVASEDVFPVVQSALTTQERKAG